MKADIGTKVCVVCGQELSIESFELIHPEKAKHYYLSTCKKCRNKRAVQLKREQRYKMSDDIEIDLHRHYKEIPPERILDSEKLGIDPIAEDEIFTPLIDYKDFWISNYGRAISIRNGEYCLLKPHKHRKTFRYDLLKDTYSEGEWKYTRSTIGVATAVVQAFIVNQTSQKDSFIWHKGYDLNDFYYKNLYPLTQKQYMAAKHHYEETGEDSEEYILKVMNDINFKPDNWSKKAMKPTVEARGYLGLEGLDRHGDICRKRWYDMMHRCYNTKFHVRQPQYEDCEVCEEWLNYSNFKMWYESHYYGDTTLDLDKDILYKGNTVYGPETCCLVPHNINTLFLNGKKHRGDLPIGVSRDKDKKKYCAEMTYQCKRIKLGTFATAEEAFQRYKEAKEKLIKDTAEQYKGKIPNKVYQAMINWQIEPTD